jgi:hypothetical protein
MFKYFCLFICFTNNISIGYMFWWITNNCWTLNINNLFCLFDKNNFLTIVRLKLTIGIRQSGDVATRCKWRIINANVSRFGFGNCWISESNFCCWIKSESSSTIDANDFHKASVNKDSDNERRKSFTTPQIKWISL